MSAVATRIVVIVAIASTAVGVVFVEHARLQALEARTRQIAAREQLRSYVHDLSSRYEFAAAEPSARAALAVSRSLHPAGDLETARDLTDLAGILAGARHYAEAAPVYHEAAEMRRTFARGDDRDLARSINDEGVALIYLGRFTESGQRFDAARAMRERLSRGDDPEVADSLHNVAWSQERDHRPADAETNYRRALDMYRRLFRGDHPSVSRELHALGWNVMEQGRWAEAEDLLIGAVDMTTRLAPETANALIEDMSLISACELVRGRITEADAWYARSVALHRRAGGAGGAFLPIAYVSGMVNDLETIDPPRAVALSGAVYAGATRTLPANSPALGEGRVIYASALLASGAAPDLSRAESLLRQALSGFRAAAPADLRTGFTQSLLGGVLLRQAEATAPSSESARRRTIARLRDAEPLVVAGFDTLASLGDTIHPYYRSERLAGAAGRAARLYDLWNRLAPDAAHAAKADRYAHDAASYAGRTGV